VVLWLWIPKLEVRKEFFTNGSEILKNCNDYLTSPEKMLCLFVVFALGERYFKVQGNDFVMDGKPFYFVSGSFHYFRVHESSWEDTVKKMINGGLNAIQSYTAWNLHEPRKGVYNFEGRLDLVRWLETCQKYDMYVLLRPGPYICAEWEFGGFPWWLNKHPQVPLRVNDPVFIGHVRDFWSVLFTKVKRFTYANGGNIIMVQIENEYRTCEKTYLKALADIVREHLGDIQLFTTCDASLHGLECGNLPNVSYGIVDFVGGYDPTNIFKVMREYNHGGPYATTEVWPGMFENWGHKHQTRPVQDDLFTLEKVLVLNGSINWYMYIGGTNFGYTNGGAGEVEMSTRMLTTSYVMTLF
jgi:beta-galactosidase